MRLHLPSPSSCWSKSRYFACVCVLLAACDSGSSDSSAVPVVAVDVSAQGSEVTAGVLSDGNTGAQLGFSLQEDTSLNGAFVNPDSGSTSTSTPATSDREAFFSEYTVLSLPQNGLLQLNADGSAFIYEPDVNFAGSDTFSYATASGRDVVVDIVVTPVPDKPALNRAITSTASQGRRYQVQLEAFDADGDPLTFVAENLPSWLFLDASTGVLTGVPGQADVGVVTGISLSVVDSTGLSDVLSDFQLEVVDINDVPILNLTQAPRELFGLQQTNFNVFPRDIENDLVEVSVEPNELLSMSVTGSQINIDVSDIEKVESTELTIVARDERGAVTRESIPIALYPRSESGKGTTLVGHREGRGVHVVILGDGYASDELTTYRQHVESVIANIRSDAGIADYVGAFNIHMIETVSQQSGADDSDTSDRVTTAFDSAYNCRAIPRLVCADVLKLFEASLSEYPDVDQIILLVNDSRYGGSGNSGGRVAITSAFYPEIALHEMGHSLADLADEYVDPLILDVSGVLPFEEGRFKNVSNLSDPQQVPWAHWINYQNSLPPTAADLGIGVFEGAFYRSTGVYRSSVNTRMRNYNEDFGPVNTEQWILRLYTLTQGVRSIFPEVFELDAVTGDPLQFEVEPIFGDAVQEIIWTLNGETINNVVSSGAANSMGIAISADFQDNFRSLSLSLPPGQHALSVTLSDISGRIQIPPPHAGIFTRQWSINVL